MADNLKGLILETSEQLGLNEPSVVEKDLYVTKVLHALAGIENEHFKLVFIGGTCLTKAHRIVARMSEDIDFKLVPLSDSTLNSKSARKEMSDFRREMLDCIKERTGLSPKENQIIKGNNNQFTQVFLDYPSLYPPNDILRQQIKLEITAQKIKTPLEYLPVASLIHEVLGKDSGMDAKTMACISLDETAAEKWAALNRRVADSERSSINPDKAIIRHLFDLSAIQKNRGVGDFFEVLIPDVVLRDREKFKGKSPYFFENTLQEIAFGTQALKQNPEWEKRYQDFIKNMVFQKDSIPFTEALTILDQLNQRAFAAIGKSQACEILKANGQESSKNLAVSIEMKYELERAKPVVRLSDATYHGKFVHIDDEYIYQETGKDELVKHKIRSLPKNQLPDVGKIGSVRYKNGEAKILLPSLKKNLKLSI